MVSRRSTLKTLACTYLTIAGSGAEATVDQPDFLTVLSRLQKDTLEKFSPGEARRWADTMGANGQWSDLDYASRAVGAWPPTGHLDRLRAIAVATQTPGHALFHGDAARQRVALGLAYWLKRAPVSDNWWHNTIGQQLALLPTLLILRDQLPPDLLRDCVKLLQVPAGQPQDRLTGQNLSWYAQQQLGRGALTESANDIRAAIQAFQSLLKLGADEGIQSDYSFHQHGHQLYSGGYGLVFLQDLTRACALVAETTWAFAKKDTETLADYGLLGIIPLIRGNWLDWSARGREVSRQDAIPRPQLIIKSLRDLSTLVPSRRNDLQGALQRVSGPVASVSAYARYYWRSDFLVQQVSAGYLSVKMCSERTIGTESGNGENLLGYWLPFGLTYLIRHGHEYEGLQPVWNWARLPGITCPDMVPPLVGYQRHPESFVTGLTDDFGGIATMHLNLPNVRGLKSWFLFNGSMVALGHSLRDTGERALRTTLNQCRRIGPVHTDRGTRPAGADSEHVQWSWHDGIFYRMLDGQSASLILVSRSRAGDPTNQGFGAQKTQAEVFELSVDHGKPNGEGSLASYAYSTCFASTPSEGLAASAEASVLTNSSRVQAVHWPNARRWAAVFHQPASIALEGNDQLMVDAACVVIVTGTRGGYDLSLEAPTAGSVGVILKQSGSQVAGTKVKIQATDARASGYKSPQTTLRKV